MLLEWLRPILQGKKQGSKPRATIHNFSSHPCHAVPSPVRDPDGGCNLIRNPAGALIMCEEPDVVLASPPVPEGEVLLDPTLGLKDHERGVGHSEAYEQRERQERVINMP